MSIDQDTLRRAILDPDHAIPDGLSDGSGQPAGRRFAVYRNNVAVSLTEALETGFPVVAKLLGDENFRAIAGVFLRAHPPQSPLMMQYGAEFPEFLAGFPPLAHIGYLSDVARLELALRASYHSADAPVVAPERFEAIAPDDLLTATITFAPSLRLLRSDWPVHSIWRYNREPDAPKPTARAEAVLILRAEFDPEPHAVSQGAADFIDALMSGAVLSDALETASVDPAFDFSQTLALLLSGNAITNIQTGAAP